MNFILSGIFSVEFFEFFFSFRYIGFIIEFFNGILIVEVSFEFFFFSYIWFIIGFFNGILIVEVLDSSFSVTLDLSSSSSMVFLRGKNLEFFLFDHLSFIIYFFGEFFFFSFLIFDFSTAINSKQRLIFLGVVFTFFPSVNWVSFPLLHFFNGVFFGMFLNVFFFEDFCFLNNLFTLFREIANFNEYEGRWRTFLCFTRGFLVL